MRPAHTNIHIHIYLHHYSLIIVDERDLQKLKIVFNDLAAASKGQGIDIETFKQFARMADMIAERSFILFAIKKPGLIDLEGIYLLN